MMRMRGLFHLPDADGRYLVVERQPLHREPDLRFYVSLAVAVATVVTVLTLVGCL